MDSPLLDFNEARDDRVAVASVGPYANHLHHTADRQPHQHVITQFLQAGCPSYCPTNSVKALKAIHVTVIVAQYKQKIQHKRPVCKWQEIVVWQ